MDLRGDWGVAGFNVEVADDPKERERGLMFVTEMPFSAGMLFVYEEPRRAVFWMKNTLIPLDMIFMDPSGVVTHIHENAIPRDLTGIDGGAKTADGATSPIGLFMAIIRFRLLDSLQPRRLCRSNSRRWSRSTTNSR